MLALPLAACVVAPIEPAGQPAPPPQPPRASAPMFFYPLLGQDDERQDRDRYECYRWAVRQTGYDPGMTAIRGQPQRAAPSVQSGSASSGAEVAAGAVTGAIVGSAASSARFAGEGAVIGALFGALVGIAAQHAQQQQLDRQREHQAALAEAGRRPMADFRRAMAACMEGRSYRVG